MNSPKPNLSFILDTLTSIRDNTPQDKEAFMDDPNARDATLMRLQDIGEQLSRIRDKFPKYYEERSTDEWHKLIGLRNIIAVPENPGLSSPGMNGTLERIQGTCIRASSRGCLVCEEV